jgi:hypothetical protein
MRRLTLDDYSGDSTVKSTDHAHTRRRRQQRGSRRRCGRPELT